MEMVARENCLAVVLMLIALLKKDKTWIFLTEICVCPSFENICGLHVIEAVSLVSWQANYRQNEAELFLFLFIFGKKIP